MIKEIYHKPGFKDLRYISFDDNLISDWKTFDALNEFESRIKQIRCQNNPVVTEADKDPDQKRARQIIASRMEFLNKINGTAFDHNERKDFELFYMKIALETYLTDILKVDDEKDRKVDSLEDPDMCKYMEEFHPRFF